MEYVIVNVTAESFVTTRAGLMAALDGEGWASETRGAFTFWTEPECEDKGAAYTALCERLPYVAESDQPEDIDEVDEFRWVPSEGDLIWRL